MMPPTDPIYRESAHALEALPGSVMLSWMADLTTIRCLSVFVAEEWEWPSCSG